jgi:type IV pilus assembly protein PilY1
LLMEFSHSALGFTSSIPAPFVHDGAWYLMLGSGPDNSQTGLQNAHSTQQGKLFLINLNTMALESTFGSSGVATLPDGNSFISDLIAVDYELDYSADAIYFGTVSGTIGSWGGKLYRVQTQNADGTLKPVSDWTPTALYDTGLPITSRPNFAIDDNHNRWVYVGSGRYLTRNDATDTSSQRFFGVKEPRDSSGVFTWGQALAPTMVDVSNASVTTDGSVSGVSGVTSFDELNRAMMDYSTDYKDGWYRDLTPAGNRVIGEATVLGGSLTHTLYKPSATACEIDGTAQLSVTYYTTGTAAYPPIIGLNSDGTTIRTTVDIGVAPSLTPSIHVGSPPDDDGGDGDDTTNSKAFIQTSTGKIISIEQKNMNTVKSGEQSWRQLQ